MAQAMSAQDVGKRVAIVGGAAALMAYAEAAQDLMAGKGTWHHELLAFKTWTAVQEYCVESKEEAGSLAVMVKMIDAHGPEKIIEMAQRCTNEDDADIIISTAHKAKGAEWDNVQIGMDFTPIKKKGDSEDDLPSRPDLMLAYVSVTRAKKQLDNSGLAWVDRFVNQEA
jgi:superfamily I DNA/RNA helicase